MTKEECLEILMQRADELRRIPKKSDFDPATVAALKNCLGPWPRALEATGLKSPRPPKKQHKQKTNYSDM